MNPLTSCDNGSFLWLKDREEFSESHFVNLDLRLDALNHPVLVVRKDPTERPQYALICIVRDCPLSMVLVLIVLKVTTLQNRTVEEAWPKNPRLWDSYLPVYPQSKRDPSKVQLRTEGAQLPKLSYVEAGQLYAVHGDMLRPLHSLKKQDLRLDHSSLASLESVLRQRGFGQIIDGQHADNDLPTNKTQSHLHYLKTCGISICTASSAL